VVAVVLVAALLQPLELLALVVTLPLVRLY
jgi:hypothetical protein